MLSCGKIAESLVLHLSTAIIYIYVNISLQKNLRHLKTFLLTKCKCLIPSMSDVVH